MRLCMILTLALFCCACTEVVTRPKPTTYPPAPEVPELPSDLEKACPELKPIPDGSIKSLVGAASGDAILYADCKKRFSDVVVRYKRVKQEQDSHKAQLERFKEKK